MGRKLVGLVCVATLTLSVLAGCGTNPPSGVHTIAPTEATEATPSAETATPTPATTTAEPDPTPADTSQDGKFFAFLRKIAKHGDRFYVTLDYAVLYTGPEALKQARKRGGDAPDEYYIANDNKKLRVFPVKSGMKAVVVLESPPDWRRLSPTEWKRSFEVDLDSLEELSDLWSQAVSARSYAYDVTIENGELTAAKTFWTP